MAGTDRSKVTNQELHQNKRGAFAEQFNETVTGTDDNWYLKGFLLSVEKCCGNQDIGSCL
jgi:hypothetical protein